MAVKLAVEMLSTEGACGETAMDCKTGSVTVTAAVPDLEPNAAVKVAVPTAIALADPLLAISSLTVATVTSLELQATSKVISWVVESENVPAAVNGLVNPLARVKLAGVTVSPVMVAPLTVRVRPGEDMLPRVAVRIAEPTVTPLTRALLGAVLYLKSATAGEALDQTT